MLVVRLGRNLAFTLILCLGACTAGSDLIRVPTEAMSPTLLVGEHFLVDREAYDQSRPELGDVVVFQLAREGPMNFPPDERPDLPTDAHIKRVVGLPGDLISIQSGRLYRNDSPVWESPTGEEFLRCDGISGQVYETRLDGRTYLIARDALQAELEGAPTTVPAGRYYLLGDYRNRSKDSRVWGTIALRDILGRAETVEGGEAPQSCPPRRPRFAVEVR